MESSRNPIVRLEMSFVNAVRNVISCRFGAD